MILKTKNVSVLTESLKFDDHNVIFRIKSDAAARIEDKFYHQLVKTKDNKTLSLIYEILQHRETPLIYGIWNAHTDEFHLDNDCECHATLAEEYGFLYKHTDGKRELKKGCYAFSIAKECRVDLNYDYGICMKSQDLGRIKSRHHKRFLVFFKFIFSSIIKKMSFSYPLDEKNSINIAFSEG